VELQMEITALVVQLGPMSDSLTGAPQQNYAMVPKLWFCYS